jgi:formate C-acetyltransferase
MKAVYRPQLIRTLFIDDCIEKGVEYNAGGARYNGSVCNVVGLANVANSLFTLKQLFDGKIRMDKDQFLAMLDADYAGDENIFAQIKHFDKFGNSKGEIDEIAYDIADFVFSEILKCRCWRANGFIVPSTILFVTYVEHGTYIAATPDGRKRGEPIADSVGPMQGTDVEGPTAMFLSTGGIPHLKGAGTLVLNARLDSRFLREPESRRKVKQMIQGYFNLGGMQIQLTVVDAAVLEDARRHPGKYPNLIIRIGGYTEYFDRLSDELKREVLKRTAHEV